MSIQRFLFGFFFFFLTTGVCGQTVFYQELNSRNGAPTDRIYDLAKDNNGLIYLGTEQGLYSFTGIKFNLIPLQSAVSNSITDISFSDDNTLWCRNFSNQVFYFQNGRLHPFPGLEKDITKEIITSLKAVGQYVYVSTYDAVYVIDNVSKTVVKRLAFFMVESIHSLAEHLVVATVEGELFYIKGSEITNKNQLDPGKYRMSGNRDLYFVEKNNLSKWVSKIQFPYNET